MPSVTRWGYWIGVLQRFFKVSKDVKNIAKQKQWIFLENEELEYLKQIYDVIYLYSDVLEAVQSEYKISISSCYPNLKILINHLNQLEVNI